MKYSSIESFVNFCDEYQIANENFISTIKSKFKQMLLTLVKAIEKMVKKCKDSKLKRSILNLLQKAKRALGDVEKIKTDDDIQEVKETIDEVQEEVEIIKDKLEGLSEREEFETHDTSIPDFVKIEKNRGINRFVNIVNISDNMFEILNSHIKTMREALTFPEYKSALNAFKSILKLPDACTINAISKEHGKDPDSNKIHFYYTQDAKPIPNKNYQLLHSTVTDNITQLIPAWKSNDGYFYNSPRVYFATMPVDRMGHRLNEKDGKLSGFDLNTGHNTTMHVYTPSIEFNKVCADTTLSNFRKIGSVYIETETPIPVTQLK